MLNKRHQTLLAACLAIACSDKPVSKNDDTTPLVDVGPEDDATVVLDDSGNVVADTGSTPDMAPGGFAAPTLDTLGQLPIQVEHLAAHAGGGWAILGVPVSGAMVDGAPLSGRFAVGVVDADGAIVWAKAINPPDQDSELGSVAADGAGNVYVGLVSFSSSIDFGDGIVETGDVDNLAQSGFVVKYDPAGVTQWATGFWADYGLANTFVAARGDHVVAGGTYTIWDPLSYRGPNGIVVGPEFKRSTTRTSFVIPLDPANGQGRWHKLYSSSSEGTTLSDVDLLDDGSILTAGTFDGYDGGTVTDPEGSVLSSAPPGGYVARFGADASLGWFTALGDRLVVATDGASIVIGGADEDGAIVGTVDAASGAPGLPVALVGTGDVVGLANEGTRIHAIVAPRPEPGVLGELDGIGLPPGRFALSLEGTGRVAWLRSFPTDVVAADIGAAASTVAIGGHFVGGHDFGDGDVVVANETSGFLAAYRD